MRRPLWTVVALLLAAALLLWVGSLRGGGSGQSALSVLAVAVVAAALATSGTPRRVLGALVVAVGVLTVPVALGAPAPALVTGLAAAAALLAAGGLLAVRGHLLPGMGARYQRRSGEPGAVDGRRAPADGHRGMWDDLDAGRDPTAG